MKPAKKLKRLNKRYNQAKHKQAQRKADAMRKGKCITQWIRGWV